MSDPLEDSVEKFFREYVLSTVALGLYDPHQMRREKLPVVGFEVELLGIGNDSVAHVAGPVVLRTADGEVEHYLRVSAPVVIDASGCRLAEDGVVRAAYIVETNPENGACKETAAFANA